jgi:cell division protease FtsH
MAMDAPAPSDTTAAIVQTSELPVVSTNAMGQPSPVRYSDFLKLVNGDKIEKVTFSADGSQLLGVDVDGSRLRIDSLPNDPDLLTQLTSHKVNIYFCF